MTHEAMMLLESLSTLFSQKPYHLDHTLKIVSSANMNVFVLSLVLDKHLVPLNYEQWS